VAISSVGTPTAATGTTSPITATYGTGQGRAAGNVLVAVVTWTGATSTTATTLTGGSGWVNLAEVASSGTLARTSVWWKPAAGGDAAPQFSSTLAGSATASCTVFELSGANGYVINTSGTIATTATITTQTATTSGNVTTAGEFGIAGFARERASLASTVTASGTYTLATSNTGVTATGHFATMTLASPGTGAASSATVNYSGSGTTSQGAGAVVVFGAGLTGPVMVPLTQPPGVRVTLVRTGAPQASLIPGAPPAPPPVVTPAPLYPLTQPARSRIPVNGPRGRAYCRPGAPLNNPTAGPVFHLPSQPARARQPLPPRGRVAGGPGGPVHNPPPPLPAFRLPSQPARSRVPQTAPRGRAYNRPGAPLNNPAAGPVFRLPAQPASARRPLPPRGRAAASVLVPAPVPPLSPARVYPLTRPVAAVIRTGAYRYGRTLSSVAAGLNPPPVVTGAPLYPLPGPARSRIPRNAPRGRAAGGRGAPLANPTAGPVFRQARTPAQARKPLFALGRAIARPGALLANPTPGPAAYPLQGPARARLPQPHPRAGRVTGNAGAPLRNPGAGPQFRQATSPVRARQPLPPGGRVTGNPGGPVHNPVSTIARIYPLTSPVRARQPFPAPGRAATMAVLPVPVTPSSVGPPFRQATSPAQARRPLRRGGRVYGNPGGPVNNPPPPALGPKVYPLTQPVRARQPLPPRGRTRFTPPYVTPVILGEGTPQQPLSTPAGLRVIFARTGYGEGGRGAPVSNPVFRPGPPFYPLRFPAAARLPRPFLAGRAATMAALPAPAPPGGSGPVFRQATQPPRIQRPLPPRGRAQGSPGAPVRNPAPPPSAPAAPLHQPARARLPQPVLPGRAATMAAFPVPVTRPAPFRPSLNKTLRAQPAIFLKGRIVTTPRGKVANPTSGVPFPPLHQPARARQPYPPPGKGFTGGQGTFTPFAPPPAIPRAIVTVAPAGPNAALARAAGYGQNAVTVTVGAAGPNSAGTAIAQT
jgi:hypothetical protein